MAQTILNPFQQSTLFFFKKTPFVQTYHLSGGTALTEFYLQHRLSEDLDFFTQDEINLTDVQKFIHLLAKETGCKTIDFQQGFALNTFFLTDKDGKKRHKIDFGQYPFEPINPFEKKAGILVESLYDIAVNKAQTIITHPRLRDFIDLYVILQKEKNWSLHGLIKKSFEKFEMKTDALQIGQNLLQVRTIADMPIMRQKVDLDSVRAFFLHEINNLEHGIWK